MIEVFALNTKLFANCLVDLTEVQARARPNTTTNSIAFIAGHLVETRAWTCRYLGGECRPPFGGLLEHATSIDQIPELPSLAEIRAGWDVVTAGMTDRLEAMTEADWSAPSSQRFPGGSNTTLGGVSFLLHHESYHIGQLAFLRRFWGLPAMSYR